MMQLLMQFHFFFGKRVEYIPTYTHIGETVQAVLKVAVEDYSTPPSRTTPAISPMHLIIIQKLSNKLLKALVFQMITRSENSHFSESETVRLRQSIDLRNLYRFLF